MSYDLPHYDSWLTKRYEDSQRIPTGIEDYLGREVYVEEEDEIGTVTAFEEWEDAELNDDGSVSRYGGVDLVVEFPNGRSRNMSPADVDECPAERAEEEK